MNSTKGDSERGYYFEQHAQAVETGAAFADRRNGSSHHPSISKSFSLLLGLFFGFMIVVVTRQQFQIYTMQKELDDLLRMEDLPYRQDEMPDEELPDSLEKLTADENGTLNAIVSRHRRQSGDLFAYAHLIGNSRTQAFPAFLWASPTSSPTTTRSYYSNIELYRPNGNDVRAIRVLCSGWYFVYAQIPYFYNQETAIGHKIVRLGRCGRSGSEVTLLETTLNMQVSGSTKNHDWKYLGGIVYLPASSHVEVRPSFRISDNYIDSSSSASQQGTFFGIYLIRSMPNMDCWSRC